ncbi:LAME_0F13960g1_1 [Lachancea meyersii CBS 8951]|uniref:LAME_0F13960g1_1 n=1 Tax=Lachancea meyersii CBS 8951 TaxID=1266667 RepID=A0A1G4JXN2_9SACH|nr:LAME_0F13960g1_1 [Lachancea meyersii CBS 8951]
MTNFDQVVFIRHLGTNAPKLLPESEYRLGLPMLESPILLPLPCNEHDSPSSNAASPVQFIKEYIEKSLNTPPGFPVSVAAEHYKRQRLIEEILESEVEYVQMLKILQSCFLDVLTINDYIPMQELNKVVSRLLPQHENMCAQLDKLVEGSIKRFDESTELNWSDLSLTSWDHLELCENVSRLLATEAIAVDLYRDYVQYYNQVSHLLTRMGQESQDRLLFAILFRIELCLPKYYSRTSQQGYKRDFSFRAMIQMPINRITKYRLFLESMVYLTEHPSITDLKRLDDTQCEKLANKIKVYMEQMYAAMKEINEPKSDTAQDLPLTLIQNRLSFDLPEERLPIEAMGSCCIKGCFAVAWPTMDETSFTTGSYRSRYLNTLYKSKRSLSIESDQLGVFLFETYLVLAEIPNLQRTPIYEWPVKFALRLSNCRLVDVKSQVGSELEDVGMFSSYSNTLKIQFDYDFKLWEILVFLRDESEFQSWYKELDVCISKLGERVDEMRRMPRQESVTQSTLESTLHFSDSTTFPEQMVPFISYDESLSGRFDRARTFKRRANNCAGYCYNGEVAKVEVEFRDSLMEYSPASTWFMRGSSSRLDLRPDSSSRSVLTCNGGGGGDAGAFSSDPWAFNAVFTRWKRVQVERGMCEVWSPQLEKVSVAAEQQDPGDVEGMGNSTNSATMRTETTALIRAASDNLITTQPQTAPVRASTFRSTRWSIKRVFSRRRSRRMLRP